MDTHDSQAVSEPSGAAPATPPNLSEALAQMNHAVAAKHEQPAGPELDYGGEGPAGAGGPGELYDEDAYADAPYGDEDAYGEGPQTFNDALADIVDERVQEAVLPVFEAIDSDLRRREVLEIMDRYPRLRDPEVLSEVAAEMDDLAAEYGDEGMRTDPRLLERIYLAYEAELTAADGGEELGERPQGATLETGAGPGGLPTRKLHPMEARWMNAFDPGRADDLISG